MNTDRLLRLADLLETVPPAKFDMRWWLIDPTDLSKDDVNVDELGEECGTTACAGSWACFLFRDEGLTMASDAEGRMPMYNGEFGTRALATFFDLTWNGSGDAADAGNLFGSTPRTPQEEAALLREVAVGGER